MNKSPVPPTGSTTSQLHHITDEQFVNAESDDTPSVFYDNGNNTNKESLLYFAQITNHYLCLVKTSSSTLTTIWHPMFFPVIADSGANYHIFKEKEFFETILPASGTVLLGDGKTTLSIKGVGTIKYKIGDHVLTVPNVRYIPELSESIYSLFVHIQTPNHGLESSYEDGFVSEVPLFYY